MATPRPAPAPKRSWVRRHKILTGLGVIVAIIIVASIATSGGGQPTGTTDGQTTSATSSGSDSNASEPTAAGMGEPVRDGKFEFAVVKVNPHGGRHLGDEVLGTDAQGRFVIVTLKVRNIGDQAQTLTASDQYLYDRRGRRFSADDEAWIALGDSPFLEQINPGNAVRGRVVFDVPKGVKLARLELHDSAFSGGVTVSLAK